MHRALARVLLLLVAVQAAAASYDLFDLVRQNDLDAVEACIIDAGPVLLESTLERSVTPLHLAAALNRVEIAELFLDCGARIDARTSNGFTPLHWAACMDAADVVLLLLERGAAPDTESKAGITPLHWAASRNATNVVKLLITSGAGVLPRTRTGNTPLHWAVSQAADDSAVMLAFRAVDQDLVPEEHDDPPAVSTNVQIDVPLPEPEAPPDMGLPNLPAIVLREAPTPPRRGATWTIDLGQGQGLSFVWLPEADVWFGVFEISNGQYRRFRPSHTSRFREALTLDENTQPAVYVSWFDAKAFCEWVNTYQRHALPPATQCRLPANDEWMLAARCGDDRLYPWGAQWPPLYGNHSDAAARAVLPSWQGIEDYDDGYGVTCPVNRSGVNPWGLYGLAGNVWEWCEDWYDLDTRRLKIRKGGGWDFEEPVSLLVDTVGFDTPDSRYDTIGFRVVLAAVH